MKLKLSLFKSVENTWNTVYIHDENEPAGDTFLDNSDAYIRISEPVEVEFTEVAKTAILQKELELIDKAEKTIAAEYQLKLTALQNRRNDLLSISHDSGNDNQD